MKKLNVKTLDRVFAAAMFVLAGCGESGTASVPPESLPRRNSPRRRRRPGRCCSA